MNASMEPHKIFEAKDIKAEPCLVGTIAFGRHILLATRSRTMNNAQARRAAVQQLADLRLRVNAIQGQIAVMESMLGVPTPAKVRAVRLRSKAKTITKICRLFDEGMPKRVIAKHVKMSRSSIYRILERVGKSPKDPNKTEPQYRDRQSRRMRDGWAYRRAAAAAHHADTD